MTFGGFYIEKKKYGCWSVTVGNVIIGGKLTMP